MTKHGWTVDKSFLLETAWRATYEHGKGGRVIGINSEVRLIISTLPLILILWYTLDGRP
jgi:hypothetical protein